MFTEPAAPHSLQAGRLSTKADPEAGCPTAHRPSADRTYRPNIGCCRSRDRPRASRPDRREGICLSIVHVGAEKPSAMIPRPATLRKLSISWGPEHGEATASRGLARNWSWTRSSEGEQRGAAEAIVFAAARDFRLATMWHPGGSPALQSRELGRDRAPPLE